MVSKSWYPSKESENSLLLLETPKIQLTINEHRYSLRNLQVQTKCSRIIWNPPSSLSEHPLAFSAAPRENS